MQEYLQNFTNETRLTLESLEVNLLNFEKNTSDIELATAVYREMHSIKGAAAMFSFHDISKLTHAVENIFSEILKQKLLATPEIFNICFQLVDFIGKTLTIKIPSKKINDEKEKIFSQISKIIDIQDILDEKKTQERSKINTFYIYLHPDADFEERGVNLFEILDQAQKLDNCVKFEKATLQNSEEQNKFYMFWEFFVGGELSLEQIKEVFIFVEDQVIIHKISEENLFTNKSFTDYLSTQEENPEVINLDKLTAFCNSLSKKQKPLTPENYKTDITTEKDAKNQYIPNINTSTINVSSRKLDELMNAVSELITVKEKLRLIVQTTDDIQISDVADKLERISRSIEENALEMRLVPLRTIMIKFERLIRELSAELGKEIRFEANGTDTELDKEIVDSLTDSLMHIFRNCIDHGIEMPEERIAKGKERQGKIHFYATYAGNKVVIQIHDDGKGINPEKIKEKAIAKKIITSSDTLTNKQLINMIYLPGFSTSKTVTSVSGRGVGLDVVRQKVSTLHGETEVDSEIGLGTYFTIKVPLTLSILDAVQIKINNESFLIPQYSVIKIGDIKHNLLYSTTTNQHNQNGEIVPLVNLKTRFGNKNITLDRYNIIYVNYNEKMYGLVIDQIEGYHQAVLKPIDTFLNKRQNFSGASVLGNGELALMLDTEKIVRNFAFPDKNKI